MGEAIGQTLSFAIAVALSPLAIIGVVLILATPRPRSNGGAFVLGWAGGLVALGTLVLLASNGAGASEDGRPADWLSILKLVLGALLFAAAIGKWRGRPSGPERAPRWMQTIDSYRSGRAFVTGSLVATANPKNALVTIGAAAAIAETGISAGEQAGALAAFTLIATLGVAVPLAIYLALSEYEAILDDLNAWMARNNTAIVAVLLLVIGAELLGDGIGGLTA